MGHTRHLHGLRAALPLARVDGVGPTGDIPPAVALRPCSQGGTDRAGHLRLRSGRASRQGVAQGDRREVRFLIYNVQQPDMPCVPAADVRRRLHQEALRQDQLPRLHGRTSVDGISFL